MAKIDLTKPINTSWAREAQEARLYPYGRDYANREAEASAVVRAIAADNPNMSGEQLAEIFSKIMAGEDFDIPEARPDFSNVESAVTSTEGSAALADVVEEPGLIGSIIRLGSNAYQNLVPWESSTAREITDNPDKAMPAGLLAWQNNLGARATDRASQAHLALRNLPDAPLSYFMLPEEASNGIIPDQATLQRRKDEALRQAQLDLVEAEADAQTAAEARQSLETRLGKDSALTVTAEGVGSAMSQLEYTALSAGGAIAGGLAAGPGGAAAFGTLLTLPTYERAYRNNLYSVKDSGLTPQEQEDYANLQAIVEFAPQAIFSVIGAGTVGAANKTVAGRAATEAASDILSRFTSSRGAQLALTGLAEASDEVAALELSNWVDRQLVENKVASTAEGQAFLEQQVKESEESPWRDRAVAAIGGASGGVAISAPVVEVTTRKRQAEAAAYSQALEDLLNSGAQNAQDAIVRANELAQAINAARRQEREQEVSKEDTELNLDIAREEERIRNEEARTRAFEQAEAERDAQRELEEEAGFQTIERGDTADSSRVEHYGGTTGRTEAVPGTPAAGGAGVVERVAVAPAQEVRPEDVAAQREASAAAERESQERAEQGKRIEAIRKAQEAQRKKAADAAKKEKTKQTKADTARHDQIVAELTKQYPDYTPAQLEPLVRERMAQPAPPPASEEKTPEQQQESVIRSVVGRMGKQRDDAQRKALTARVQRYVRANPNATADDVVAAFTGQPVAQPEAAPAAEASTASAPVVPVREAPTTPDNKLSDQEVDDLAGRFLGMADSLEGLRAAGQARRQTQESTDTEATPDVEDIPLIPEIDMEDFKARTKQFVRGLVSRGRGDSRSVQQMLMNGQLAFVPNAASIGRNTDNVAEYDVESGQMFLFADKLKNPGDAVAAIARAFHEATHAGQFNDREGRSNLFRHFLGDGKVQKSASTIRKAAANGNTVAANALNRAELDSFSRAVARGEEAAVAAMAKHDGKLQAAKDEAYSSISDASKQFEDLEVVGYFTSEVVESRRGTLGTVGGVVRDITTGAREFLRDNLGLDLDITVDDLATAAANVGSEIVQTDVRGLSQNPNVLGMIYNIDPDNLTPQQQEAIDNGWVYDSVDGTQKYVLTDEGSSIREGAAERLRRASTPTPLSEVLSHPILFEQSPDTANIPVYALDELLGDKETRGLYMPNEQAIYVNKSLLSSPDDLRSTLLHEVQHYLQDAAGLSHQFYDGNKTMASRQEAQDALQDRTEDLDAAARTFLDAAPRMLNSTERGRVMRIFMQNNNASDTAKAAKVRDYILGLENPGEEVLDAIDAYEQARIAYNEYLPTYNAAVEQEHADYLANIAEREARFTQYNMDNNTTGINPEPVMRRQEADPETGVDLTRGRIDVPTGDGDVTPMSREQVVLGMAAVDAGAADYSPTNSPAFREWFGKSQVKDAKGKPQVYYHGTKHYFTAFRPNELGLIFASPNKMFAEAFAGMDWEGSQRGAIPLYVRAENVWHYDNPDHVAAILNDPAVAEFVDLYYGDLADSRQKMSEGDWSLIETPEVIDAIKAAGFDALTVYEGGAKNIAVFTPNQLKHATDNKGTWSRQDDSFLGMRTATSDAPASTGNAARSRVVNAGITSIFRNDKGLGEQVLNWVELSKSSPAYDSMAAEAKLRDYQNGLEELARERGTDVRSISNEIANKLDGLAKDTDKYSENKAAWAKVLADYGKAGEALMDMRNKADALAINILQLRDQQGGDLTPAEQRAYKAMAANLGRYVHRMYAAGSGKAGRKYSQAMWNAHMKGKDPKANMTTAEKHNAAVVQRALNVLADSLTIPDDDTLLQMDRPAVSNLYDTWVGTSSEGLDIVEMADRLIEVRDTISPERINNQAEQTAQELLGLLKGDVTTPLGKFYRGNKLDRGILQERKQIDPAIRELMGEIRDPGVALLGTVGKQAEFVARQKLMLQLRSAVGRDLQPPSATGTSVVLDNNMQRLEGPDFGALEGWYASPNMKLALDSTAQHLVTLEQALANMGAQPGQVNDVVWTKLREGWMTLAGFTKATSILGNPILFGINFVGSFDTMLMNGNYTSPTTQTRALKEALELITYAVNPSASSEATRLLAKYGVIDSAQIGELKNMNYKQIQDHIRSLVKQDGKRRKLLNFGRGVTMGWKEAYAMMDVWAKIANFHQNVNDITAYNKAEGKGWTQEQIYERASAATKRLNISYQRAAPFIKALERGGITMFGTYFYETFRVQAENIAEVYRDYQAAKDATTPEGRNVMLGRATKRALGIIASNALKYVAAKKFAELVFGDDEDKWYNMRGLLPEFLQNQDFIPVGRDKDGHVVVFPISRLDPLGPNTDIIREIIHGNGDPKKVAQQLLDLYIAPRIAGSIIAQVADKGREPTFQQVAPGVYGEVVNATGGRAKVVKAFTNVAETALPGIANAYRSNNAAPIPTDPASQAWAYSTYLGNRLYKIDPNESARFAGFEYSNFDKAAKDEVKEYFKSQTNPTVEDVQRVVTRITGDEKKEWDKLRRLYLGMEGFGMSSSDINAVLKDSPIPKAVQTTVANGTFVPNAITIRSLETYRNNIKKGKSDREKEEVDKKWDAMIDTLTQVLQDE